MIGGTVAALGLTSGTLLTGSVRDIGFVDPPGGEIFEFHFHLTGGELAPYFDRKKIGVILDAGDTPPAGP